MRILSLTALIACSSEYNVKSGTMTTDEDTLITVSQTGPDGPVCRSAGATLTLTNVSSESLTISELEIVGGGWSLTDSFAPTILEMGASLDVSATTTGEPSALKMTVAERSDVTLEFGLTSQVDQTPSAELLLPSGTTLTRWTETEIQAQVADDVDRPQDLVVRLLSDLDGEVPLESVDASVDASQVSVVDLRPVASRVRGWFQKLDDRDHRTICLLMELVRAGHDARFDLVQAQAESRGCEITPRPTLYRRLDELDRSLCALDLAPQAANSEATCPSRPERGHRERREKIVNLPEFLMLAGLPEPPEELERRSA